MLSSLERGCGVPCLSWNLEREREGNSFFFFLLGRSAVPREGEEHVGGGRFLERRCSPARGG